jgi:predicted ATPase
MTVHLPAGTVTLLFTDIEGSTRLLQALGPDAYADALTEHRRLLREAFTASGGVEVDTQGDAFFVAFPTATGAADAALSGLEALADGPVRVRLGLPTGTPTRTGEGYVGVDVHRGARIAALAHGGQALISPSTAALLDGYSLRELGAHRLKDFDGAAVLHQLGTERFPPLRAPGSVDLPAPATRFLGRERELHRAVSLVLEHDPRVLTIVGPGGTGKTRFALELARLLADEADGGTTFVPLAPVADPELALPTLAEAIGAERPDVESIAARVGRKRTHVLLDNLEQLLPAAARSLASVVEAAPTLRLLVTSRESLRIEAEVELDLPPLETSEAVELFLARAEAASGNAKPSPAVTELCERLDRLPLAVELAAARTKLLTPEALLERLGERLDLLRGTRDADPRHATLEATIRWSYDLLEPEEQSLFADLAVFPAGCTLDAAVEVCQADLEVLASLLDKSLLRRRTDPDGGTRYWMLETIRAFATERLTETGREPGLRRRQLAALAALGSSANLVGDGVWRGPWEPDRIVPELDNVRAALEWALIEDQAAGLVLASSLEAFWVTRAPWEGTAWLERLLAAAPTAAPEIRSYALLTLASQYDIVGNPAPAAPLYRESRALFAELGDELQEAWMCFRLGANLVNQALTGQGDPGNARQLIDEALPTFARLGSRMGEAQVAFYGALLAWLESDYEAAVTWGRQSAAIAREIGWSWCEGLSLGNLAEALINVGRFEEAERAGRRSIALASELGDRMSAVFACANLAEIAALVGDRERAGRLWGAIEGEESLGPIGQWEAQRAEAEGAIMRAAGPDFERGRAEGRFLTVAQAAGVAEAS